MEFNVAGQTKICATSVAYVAFSYNTLLLVNFFPVPHTLAGSKNIRSFNETGTLRFVLSGP